MSKFVKLSSIAELTVGFVGTMAMHYEDEGIPFLRSLNIKPFKIIGDDMKYVSAEFSNSLSKSILHKGDVVIVRTGIPGTCCVVPAEYDGCNCSDIVIVHPNAELVNPHYLAAYINVWGQRQIANNKVGAIQQHFNVHSAEEMLIFLPDITEQEKIAKMIVALNGKIENNTSVCAKLESMAKTLYDYWFTQFDFPDENGKPYSSSGGEMVWNDQLKRKIPKGWTADVVSNLFSKVPNTTRIQTGDYLNDGDVPVVDQSADFIAGYTNDTGAALSSPTGYIVFGDHTRIVKYVRFPFARGADGTQVLKSNTPRVPDELLYQIIKSIDLTNYGYARHFKFLKDTTAIIPDESVAKRYAEIVIPIYDKQVQLIFENRELTKLRDWLLPMLMNGQATVE